MDAGNQNDPLANAGIPTLALSPEAAAKAAGVGRTAIFQAIREKKLVARKNGARTLVMVDDLGKYLRSLPQAGKAEAA